VGIKIPDIVRVVQYQVSDTITMCNIMQRAGRAARGSGRSGRFIWLVNSWCFGPTAEQLQLPHKPARVSSLAKSSQQEVDNASGTDGLGSSDLEQSVSARKSKGVVAKAEAKRRSNLAKGFWKLFNRDTCIRRGILEYFGEDLSNFHRPAGYCCCKCAGVILKLKLAHAVHIVQSVAKITKAVKIALLKWRTTKASSWFKDSILTKPSILLPDYVVCLISRAAGMVTDLSSLEDMTRKQWAGLDLFGSEVFEVIQLAKAEAESQVSTSKVAAPASTSRVAVPDLTSQVATPALASQDGLRITVKRVRGQRKAALPRQPLAIVNVNTTSAAQRSIQKGSQKGSPHKPASKRRKTAESKTSEP